MIVIIDCGSQYTQNIARRIREIGVFCEIYPFDTNIDKIKEKKPDGIIISGGPSSVYDKGAHIYDKNILNLNIPILGICYGMQSIAYLFGGLVIESQNREYGKTELKITKQNKILKNIPDKSIVWMSHGDIVKKVPKDFSIIARTDYSIAGMENSKKNIFCVQFHPEVDNTIYGRVILNNFVNICNPSRDWTMKNYIEAQIDSIRRKVGKKLVVGGVSGGIDSSVAGVILNKAIGGNFYPIFVDNGLLRKDEAKKVVMTFKDNFNMDLRYVDAKKLFIKKLKGVVDPEKKEK